jgi:NADH dehydrogenase (ubiquinone) 1 beta subcomplex subunit 8
MFRPISPDNVVDYAGDYPDLGFMTYDNRDPYEMYSYPHERRNWGEPVS